MIRVARTMHLDRPMPDAVRFLADFGNAREWDPATVSCDRLDRGPVGPGSRWRNVSRFRGRTGEVVYRLDVREEDRLVFRGENGTVLVEDDLRFAPVSGGSTRLVYRAVFRFKGLARLAEPFLRAEVNRLADGVAEALPGVLAR
ncbi:SRPBCC family protein [Streptomyces sp. NPDC090077]|uniref:SRPBCC family protein n=1 Tax=Streptomyces sp. NPDC090077 TaxID=3365938 RepID=UPI00380052D7